MSIQAFLRIAGRRKSYVALSFPPSLGSPCPFFPRCGQGAFTNSSLMTVGPIYFLPMSTRSSPTGKGGEGRGRGEGGREERGEEEEGGGRDGGQGWW